jgi:putative ABC transport system permease protein
MKLYESLNLYEFLRTALIDLSRHKFRSALATLGIIFGVASVEGMISISEGARLETLARIAVLGVDNILIRSVKPPKADGKEPSKGRQYIAEFGLLRKDLAHLRTTFPAVRHAVGIRDVRMSLYATGGRELDLRVMATEPEYLAITRSSVLRGRFLTPEDAAQFNTVCVLGAEAARKLFGFNDPLAGSVRVGSDWYKVVGILENRAALRAAGGDDINRYVFIPLATAMARYGDVSNTREAGTFSIVKVELDGVALQMADTEAVLPTAKRIENYLHKTHKQKDCELLVPMELIRQKAATQRVFAIIMASIAGISLLVGGIGIMNIMLANVYDRRKEIGVRRALGARRADIMRQFVLQAAALTTLGGLAGTAVGYGLARGVSHYAGWPTAFTAEGVVLGVGVSILVGLVFGLWPAWQAACLDPVQTLRAE